MGRLSTSKFFAAFALTLQFSRSDCLLKLHIQYLNACVDLVYLNHVASSCIDPYFNIP